MAKENVVNESFGTEVKQPSVSRGKIEIFGHMVNDRKFDDNRVVSVNVKTGYPVKGNK